MVPFLGSVWVSVERHVSQLRYLTTWVQNRWYFQQQQLCHVVSSLLTQPDVSPHAVCFHELNKMTHILLHFSLRPKEMLQASCSKMPLPPYKVWMAGYFLVSSHFPIELWAQRPVSSPTPVARSSLPLLASFPHPQGQTKFTAFGSQEFEKCCSNRLTQPRGRFPLNSGIYTLHDHFAALSPPHTQARALLHGHTHCCVMVPVSLLSKGIWLGLVCKSQYPLNGVCLSMRPVFLQCVHVVLCPFLFWPLIKKGTSLSASCLSSNGNLI